MQTEPDIAELRAAFERFECPGVVALINHLASPEAEGLMEIGSNTLDLRGDVARAKTEEERIQAILFKTQSFYLGSRNGSVTPLQSIAQILSDFDSLSREHQELFDRICSGFAGMATAPRLPLPAENLSFDDGLLTEGEERRRPLIN